MTQPLVAADWLISMLPETDEEAQCRNQSVVTRLTDTSW